MQTQLIIFDKDGVLVDSEPLIKIAQIKAFGSQGAYLTPEWCYSNLHGLRAADVIAAVEAHTGVTIDVTPTLAEFSAIFTSLIDSHLQPTSGIASVLAQLQALNKPFCIGTSGPLPETFHKLKATQLAPYFPNHHVFSGEQVARGKPAPDLFLLAASTMGVPPAACTVVEDAPFGIMAAKAAGMYAIGYMGGGHVAHTQGLTADTLYEAGADLVIHTHEDLLKAIP